MISWWMLVLWWTVNVRQWCPCNDALVYQWCPCNNDYAVIIFVWHSRTLRLFSWLLPQIKNHLQICKQNVTSVPIPSPLVVWPVLPPFCLQILVMMIKMIMKTGFIFLLEGLAGFPLFSVPVRHLLKAYLVLMIMLNFFLICKTFFQIKKNILRLWWLPPKQNTIMLSTICSNNCDLESGSSTKKKEDKIPICGAAGRRSVLTMYAPQVWWK